MRLLKKSVSVLLSLVMVVSVFAAVPFEAAAETLDVTTWEQLRLAIYYGKSAVLGADITGGETDSFLDVQKNVSVDLNGFTLNRGKVSKAETGNVFKIAAGFTLTITDSSGSNNGKITGGSSEYGGAFYNNGTLNIESGTITNNSSSKSGGTVYNNGTFNMSGGVISSGVSVDGGAVYNAPNGIMTLSGSAKLTNNEATSENGGAVTNKGTLTITDTAEISQNKAFLNGGGIWSGGSATLNFNGGTVTGNNAGRAGNGVYCADGKVNMQGSPVIKNNDNDDLFLSNGRVINITGKLVPVAHSSGECANVGVVTPGADRKITSGYASHNPGSTDPYMFFFSFDYHTFSFDNGELYSQAYKTTCVYRYWDQNQKKVRSDYRYINTADVIDVATLKDDRSVGMHSGNWYIVKGDVKITHRLNIVGEANLILGDGATLTCADGIRSERKLNSVLNIYGRQEGTGKLIAETSARDWAAIGGNETGDAGTLNVYGGNIDAKGLRSGIAGGTDIDKNGGAGGPVNIYGGVVSAIVTGNSSAGAAIGGGNYNVACWQQGKGIAIYGGTVTAKAHYGAGIGNGSGKFSKDSGSIAIYGGKVDAYGESGIGGGNGNGNPQVDIYGGDVKAVGKTGRTAGAGIGAGFNASQRGSINILGGSVLAVGSSGAGIGGGYNGNGGEINISGGMVVANAARKGAGIGGGGEGKGGTVKISGGIVHATSTTYDRTGELYKDVEKFFGGFIKVSTTKSAIDNYMNAAAMLLILSITAIVDYSRDNNVVGSGIGGGYDASGGAVQINGGAIVYAKTGASASAIGKGKKGDGNGDLDIGKDHMVLAGSSLDNLTKVSAASRVSNARGTCVEVLPCDHKDAEFDKNTTGHLVNCKWCSQDTRENHKYESSGLKCTVCGYERVLVTFDANGGSKTMEPVYITKGSEYVLPSCKFSPPQGKVFIGWSADSDTELIAPETPVNPDASFTLKANWSDYLGLTVNDTAVTQSNKDDVLGDGNVKFDSDSCELILDEANITSITAERLALTVKGKGVINNPSGNAISNNLGMLTLNGDFDITGAFTGINVTGTSSRNGKLIVAGGNIKVTAGYHAVHTESALYLNNAIKRFEATSTNSMGAISAYATIDGKFVIGEELYIKEPQNAVVVGDKISGNPPHVIIEPRVVTAGFDSNGAVNTGEYAMQPINAKQTNTVELPECAFKIPDGKVFAGWKLGDKMYQPGDDYTFNSESVTFTAIWKNEVYAITFHSNIGEDETARFEINYGEDFILPENTFDYPDDMLPKQRWKEDPVSEEKLHKFGSVITITDDIDLYGMYFNNHTHTLTPVEATAPGCETYGNAACFYCESCHKYFADAAGTQRLREEDLYIEPTGHTAGEPVTEYYCPPEIGSEGSYDTVVYCSVCDTELSREEHIIPMKSAEYVDAKGTPKFCEEYYTVDEYITELSDWMVVTQDIVIPDRLTVSGNADLILCDGATLTATKGITVNEGATLTIWQQQNGTGAIVVNGCETNNAAIGGCDAKAGNIIINGGTFDLTAGASAAAIGGALDHDGGNITINNGKITATGGSEAAAIGGGKNASSGNITINGGTVTATPERFGTGIGGGLYGVGGTVVINGGTVTVPNVPNTNGIGSGLNGSSTTVTLNWTDDTKDDMSVTNLCGFSGSSTVKLTRPFEDKNSGTIFYKTDNADKTQLNGKTLIPYTKLFMGHSLSLEGSIGVNFFLNLTEEQAQKATVSFTWFNKSLPDVPVKEAQGKPGVYTATCPVAVAEMTYEITASVKINGTVQDETNKYKVVDYANYILTNQDFISQYKQQYSISEYEKLETLVKIMLDYGTKAQVRFDRNKDSLANGGTDHYTAPVTITNNSSNMTYELDKCGLTYVGSSVIYLSGTTLRHYYKITEPAKFTQAVKDSIVFDGSNVTYGERDGMIYFDKKNIVSSMLDRELEIEIIGQKYHYSVLDYSAKAYNDPDSTQIDKELAAAVYRYNAAAKSYFGR